MKQSVIILGLACAAATAYVALGHAQQAATAAPPPWAYGFTTPVPPGPPPPPAAAGRGGAGRGGAPAPPDETLRTLPGSDFKFTRAQIGNAFGPADWFPGDHPKMPDIVASGRMPDARACSLCHYPNGKGRPENAGPAGLPVVYIEQQLSDFRNDRRTSADYRKDNTGVMITIAKAMSDAEIKAAAEYFTQIKFDKPWITVKETDMVPKTRIAGGMFLTLDEPGTEPIGNRIIEVPENTEGTETLRNPALWIHRVRADRQLEEGSAGRDERRQRQDHAVHRVPRRGIEGDRPDPRYRRPVAELHRATALRLQGRNAQRLLERSDEAGGRQADRRRHAQHRRLRSVEDALAVRTVHQTNAVRV